ncbi:hypothetical protein PSECIP111854_01216 [Pseudoalteromonas sp. CIP111854]|uniref:prephenate dehydratase n=1 Tax=Pseudoalteromonas holothuriae TaxID=2963714 RepID=A0A9W4W284_9GAMM|nr:prephenate dehydratase domain-containing protein [Pseudoalteromonas sp. CIP111854]CAH9053673.1 hypothetical protein PSECIP111854_01216 [Pseudoalteromonas sp. CIP111854]
MKSQRQFILRVSLVAAMFITTPSVAKIYVQASAGSFNDAAIHSLFAKKPLLKDALVFSGSPTQTFQNAYAHNALAFSAVENSTIEGRLVKATVDALKQYEIKTVVASITTAIEMCVLMRKDEFERKQPIVQLASHPAALKQINQWKKNNTVKELAIPQGTAAAAKMVSQKQVLAGTVAIGSCALESLYSNLVVLEKGIQDNRNNETTFLLMEVAKRVETVDEDQAKEALKKAIRFKPSFFSNGQEQ